MLVQKLNVDDMQLEKEKKFDGTMSYAQNKRQQVVHFVLSVPFPLSSFSYQHNAGCHDRAICSPLPQHTFFYDASRLG